MRLRIPILDLLAFLDKLSLSFWRFKVGKISLSIDKEVYNSVSFVDVNVDITDNEIQI